MIYSILPKPREIQVEEGFYQGDPERTEQICDDSLEAEGYRLKIGAQAIEMRAKTQAGFYYAEQTLRQLQRQNGGKLPLCEIVDAPVFAHRGFMLDCVRHFFPVADLKRLIEAAARMKLNRFHWHLTDDQGWRIEISAFPKLTELACMRPFSNFGRSMEYGPHGGYYTKSDIREIVAFCAERHIRVIPEIEMPGHASALLSAYPEYSCDGKPVAVKTRGGVYADTLCAGKEETYAALEAILMEVMELFPGKQIHLGGDEAPKDHWKACPLCQRKMLQEGLKSEVELQCWFTDRMAAFLKSHGREAVVWNDALKGGGRLSPEITLQYWVGGDDASTVAHANAGGAVIQSPNLSYYLDMCYGVIPLDRAYAYVPYFPEQNRKESTIGVETPIWTEYMPDMKKVGYMAFPRMAAVAETGWCGTEGKDAQSFRCRVKSFLPLVSELGIEPAPEAVWNMKKSARIRDALNYWYHALTWADLMDFVNRLRQEKKERDAQ